MPATQVSLHPSPQQARRQQSTTHQRKVIEAGCVLWLPRKDKIKERLLVDVEVNDGCFHHPIVVLSNELTRGKATVLIVSILI